MTATPAPGDGDPGGPPDPAGGPVTLDRQHVAAARLWAAARMPYLASALFAANVRADPGSGTVRVDRRWEVRADPAVANALEVAELGRLLLHLIGHLLRDHAVRAETAGVVDRDRWNRCVDAEVNDDVPADLVPRAAPDLPAALGCAPHRLAEEYLGTAGDGPRRWDCGSGADGRPDDGAGSGLDGTATALLRLAVAAEVTRAGRTPGTVPGGWLRWAEALLPSRLDWRRVLAGQVRAAVAAVAGSVDFSYRRPSRRGAAVLPVILPTMVRPVPEVAVVCDTSGSMSQSLLDRALAEVEAILARAGLPGGSLRVLAVDTAVHTTRRVTRASQVVLAGGGGTDMGAGIAAAAALRPRPSVVIVLTDGWTPWPPAPPRGIRVVVGLLAAPGMPTPVGPDWARSVLIEDDTGG